MTDPKTPSINEITTALQQLCGWDYKCTVIETALAELTANRAALSRLPELEARVGKVVSMDAAETLLARVAELEYQLTAIAALRDALRLCRKEMLWAADHLDLHSDDYFEAIAAADALLEGE